MDKYPSLSTKQQRFTERLSCFFMRHWYQEHSWITALLMPFSILYATCMLLRRFVLKRQAIDVSIPVWVIGNITCGGVGKTPLVAAIAHYFTQRGEKVGIVSRGYKARCHHFPYEVQETDTAAWVGDEPLLLKQTTKCPVVIAPQRVQAVYTLMERYQLDLILSDDGLQHESMGRCLEIVVIDGVRGWGNGQVLPAGPLRESIRRLQTVDICVVSEPIKADLGIIHPYCYSMNIVINHAIDLKTKQSDPLDRFRGQVVNVVTGIGDPDRFLRYLIALGIIVKSYVFPNHHLFTSRDFASVETPIFMTEKDAIKCCDFAQEGWYSVPMHLHLNEAFWEKLEKALSCNVK